MNVSECGSSGEGGGGVSVLSKVLLGMVPGSKQFFFYYH